MARQRFIWPSLWDDPDLGRLEPAARLLYIACFSLADDEGRLIGDPVWLKGAAFRYSNMSPKKVQEIRDRLADTCSQFHVYTVRGNDYVAFLNWSDFQKPKYAKESKLPPPFPEDSGNVPETLEERSAIGLGWVGKDRVGLDREGQDCDLPAEISILKDMSA